MATFRISASSHVGCVRTHNEDMVLVDDQLFRDAHVGLTLSTADRDRFIVALADGMGGHQSGDVASRETLENLRFFYGDLPAGLSGEQFRHCLASWHASIHAILDSKAREDHQLSKMGTTFVALAYYGGHYYWLNCGDSRLYLYRDGNLAQLTTDHSLNNRLGTDGPTNLITNCIGGGCRKSYVDITECTGDVQPGHVLMLCSDGLSDLVSDDAIADMLSRGSDAEQLCLAAEKAGGSDNVSVVVIRVEP